MMHFPARYDHGAGHRDTVGPSMAAQGVTARGVGRAAEPEAPREGDAARPKERIVGRAASPSRGASGSAARHGSLTSPPPAGLPHSWVAWSTPSPAPTRACRWAESGRPP